MFNGLSNNIFGFTEMVAIMIIVMVIGKWAAKKFLERIL